MNKFLSNLLAMMTIVGLFALFFAVGWLLWELLTTLGLYILIGFGVSFVLAILWTAMDRD